MKYPQLETQEDIADYLDAKSQQIDSAISLVKEKISQLHELRRVIVSDVVTGKIDFRNVAVPEYEHVDDIADDDSEGDEEIDETEIDGEED